MLNADAFRTGVAVSSICAYGTDNKTVEHVLFIAPFMMTVEHS